MQMCLRFTIRMKNDQRVDRQKPAQYMIGWRTWEQCGGNVMAGNVRTGLLRKVSSLVDDWSFRRSKYFEHVGNEHNNIRNNVGIIDITSFSKFRVSGESAESYLDNMVARRLPKTPGRIQLCHVLTRYGGVRSEFTVTRNADGSFYLVSSGSAERFDWSFLNQHLPDDGSVKLENLTTSHGTLVVCRSEIQESAAKTDKGRFVQ